MDFKEIAQMARDEAKRYGVQFMDIRIREGDWSSISLQDGKADKIGTGKGVGMGIRVLLNGVWGFASSDEVTRERAMDCLKAAVEMAKASLSRVRGRIEIAEAEPIEDIYESHYEIDPRSIPLERKKEILSSFEKAALAKMGDKAANTMLWYSDSVTREIVCNTFGTLTDSKYVRVRIGARMTAKEGDIRRSGYEGVGRISGFEVIEGLSAEELSVAAAETALNLLSAKRPPAGKFPVIFHPDISGIFIHEALGHNAEADLVLKGESILEGKLGTKIASDLVTVIDDATMEGEWGFYKYDSEGVPGQRRTIIDKGVLVGFMHSLETAAKFGVKPNGSARAQDHGSRPIVRMSNTFVAPGSSKFEDMVKDIDLGILLRKGQWGYVMCEKGQYTCHAGEAFLIKDGEIRDRLCDVSISGMILETLENVDAVSEEFMMEKGGGTCGKDGQGMAVSGGGPYIRVKEVVVGGQELIGGERR
jgi:TldD protein